jgi:hypothetical protein
MQLVRGGEHADLTKHANAVTSHTSPNYYAFSSTVMVRSNATGSFVAA